MKNRKIIGTEINVKMEQITITNITREELISIIEKAVGKMTVLGRAAVDVEEPIGVRAAAKILNLSLPSLYRKTHHREIPHCKQGNRLYFFQSELIKWVESGKILSQREVELVADRFAKSKKSKFY